MLGSEWELALEPNVLFFIAGPGLSQGFFSYFAFPTSMKSMVSFHYPLPWDVRKSPSLIPCPSYCPQNVKNAFSQLSDSSFLQKARRFRFYTLAISWHYNQRLSLLEHLVDRTFKWLLVLLGVILSTPARIPQVLVKQLHYV